MVSYANQEIPLCFIVYLSPVVLCLDALPCFGCGRTRPAYMRFLRAFFEGCLFEKALLGRMLTWNMMFFSLRYGYGLMYFKLPRYFWINPLPEFAGHSGPTGSFAFACLSRSLYLTGTLNLITPSRPFFFLIALIGTLR